MRGWGAKWCWVRVTTSVPCCANRHRTKINLQDRAEVRGGKEKGGTEGKEKIVSDGMSSQCGGKQGTEKI